MYQRQYFVPKNSGTLSDTLMAFGVADVLTTMVKQHTKANDTTLIDSGVCYVVDLGVTVQEAWIEKTQPFESVAYVTSSKVQLPAGLSNIRTRNVDEEWDRFHQYLELLKQTADGKLAEAEMQQAIADLKPQPDWIVATYLGDYRMQAQAIHNQLVELWLRTGDQYLALNLRTLLALFASLTADWNAIAAEWKQTARNAGFRDTVTASQLFNPHMGKGQNRAKANGLSMGNENSFWLLEYMKVVGLWAAAVPLKVSNADVRKTYVLAPTHLDLDYHARVFRKFRDRMRNEGAVKQDITTALLYTETLLQQSIEDDALAIFAGGSVANLVAGMNVATYQLLSQNSYTMMNLAFLGLPDWMPHIRTSQDAEQYVDILQEHRGRIRSIDESKSEGYALLQLYRDFLSGNYLESFYEFCVDYSGYLISALDRGQFYVKPFAENNMRRLFEMTKPELSAILQDDGFRNIPRAIRLSTVTPLYLGRNSSRFEVRYGLGQELKRKSRYADDFAQALSDFMQSYNDETMRVHERTKGRARRKLITTQDIESIIRLIDIYNAPTVCNLLVAFGYARDPKVEHDNAAELTGNADATSPLAE